MELLKPFANTGEKEVFDTDTSPDGLMSLEKGFTQLFELKPEEGGLFILRKKFNQLMYLMSKANVEFNTQSFPNWIADKGDGSPYAYNKGVIVTYTDNMPYVSLINNNTEEPTTGSNWKIADLNNYMDLLTNQNVDGIKNFSLSPTAPTPTLGDSSTKLATTEFVLNNAGGRDVATALEAQQQTNNEKVITPLRLKDAFLGANQFVGSDSFFQKLPGGIIVQIGRVGPGTAGNVTITLPTTFTAGVYYANTGWRSSTTAGIDDKSSVARVISNSQIEVYRSSSSETNWLVIGK